MATPVLCIATPTNPPTSVGYSVIGPYIAQAAVLVHPTWSIPKPWRSVNLKMNINHKSGKRVSGLVTYPPRDNIYIEN